METRTGKAGLPTRMTFCYWPAEGRGIENESRIPDHELLYVPHPTRSVLSPQESRLWGPINRNGI